MITQEFSFGCTTCKATLKVRDPSAIGQILACPKCGSMVMVEAPAIELDDFEDSELALAEGETEPPAQPSDAEGSVASAGTGWLPVSIGIVSSVVLVASAVGFAWTYWSKSDVAYIANRPEKLQLQTELPVESASPSVEAETNALDAMPSQSEVETVQQAEIMQEPPEVEQVDPTPAPEIAVEEPQFTSSRILPPEFEEQEAPKEDINSLSTIAQLLTGSPPKDEPEERRTTAKLSVATLASKSAHTSSSSSSIPENQEKPITQQVESRIRAVRFEKVPLVEFVRTIAQLSGVSIQIDPIALQQSGNVIDVPVSAVSIDQPAIELLRLALEPIRMMPAVEDRGVRITSPRLEDHRLGEAAFFVGDLQAARGRDLDLATLVATLIEPDSWEPVGGVGSVKVKRDELIVRHTHAVRIRTLILLEKLRVARGLRPRKKLPERYTALETRWSQLNRYLRRPINMDVWQEQPILDVIRELEEASGLRVVVDWLALQRVGVTAKTSAVLYARQKPAAEVFQHLVDTLDGSALVPISGDAVQITTAEAASTRPYLEFYSLQQLGEAGRAQVEQLMLSGAAALDPASEVAIVVGSSEVHRRLAN